MKEITGYLKNWFTEDIDLRAFGYTVVFLAFSIYTNYTFGVTSYISRPQTGFMTRLLFYIVIYSLAYLFPFWLLNAGKMAKAAWSQIRIFLVVAVFAPALDSALVFYPAWLVELVGHKSVFVVKKFADNIAQTLVLVLPVWFYHLYSERKRGVYGLRAPKTLHPYFIMLALMLVGVAIASFFRDFRIYYPGFRLFFANPEWVISPVMQAGLFELVYGMAFVATEIFYRGFLILAPARILGRQAVLPAASLYCFIHFQKPVFEAISSFPGGLILGIVTAATASIYGGVIIHLGIAWGMEIAGHMHNYFSGDLLLEKIRLMKK